MPQSGTKVFALYKEIQYTKTKFWRDKKKHNFVANKHFIWGIENNEESIISLPKFTKLSQSM